MKNKLISLLAAGSMLLSAITVSAEEINEKAILAVFDENNFMVELKTDIKSITTNSDKYIVEIESDVSETDTYKLILPDSKKIVSDVTVTKSEENTAPSVTPAPTASPSPTEAPIPNASTKPVVSSDSQKYPSVYPTHKDAVLAMALVESVTKTIDENDETVIKINCFYQGEERTLIIEEDVTLSDGRELTSLKKGDMIHFTARLSGKINHISLDYRPSGDDIVKENPDISSLQGLLGTNGSYDDILGKDKTGYLFGIIGDKSKSSFTLYDADGSIENSADLSFSKDTIVYVCDMEKKTEVEIGTTASIIKSSIPKAYRDEDDNILEWNDDCDYVYALVNVIDDEVVEMIVYTY